MVNLRSYITIDWKTKMKKFNKTIFWVIALTFIFLPIALFTFTETTFSGENSDGLDYFKGNWTVTMRNNPQQSFNWTVKEDLNQSWLNGLVEQNGNKISTDFWRQNGNKIERFAFTGNSTFVKIQSSGWEGNKMILNGIMSDKSGETKIKETITKINDHQFNSLWEMQKVDGKWTIFGDEICKK